MSSTTTCHLSSIEICNGDDVILIPVKYQHTTETCQMVYGTNSSCSLAHLPLTGKYRGFGRVDLDKGSDELCTVYRNCINENLMNNGKVRAGKSKFKFFSGDKFYVFKRESYDEALSTEWSSDHALVSLADNKERYLQTQEITTNEQLLGYLHIGALVEISGNNVTRFGYQVIRRDIFESFVERLYHDARERISSKIASLFDTVHIGDAGTLFEIGENLLASKTLELFNVDSYLVHRMLRFVRLFIETGSKSVAFSGGLLHWALVCKIYADVGKSFYPNVRRHGSMQPIYELNQIVNSHIEQRREANIKEWMEEDDDPIPSNFEWADSSIY